MELEKKIKEYYKDYINTHVTNENGKLECGVRITQNRIIKEKHNDILHIKSIEKKDINTEDFIINLFIDKKIDNVVTYDLTYWDIVKYIDFLNKVLDKINQWHF